MSSEAKACATALHLQFKEELRQVELLEQEEKRAEELRKQEEERVLQEQEWRHQELMACKEEERRLKELARTLAREQWLVGEKRKRDEERIRVAEVSREKAMEEGEVEMAADPGMGPHIEMKKRKHTGSGFTILRTLTIMNRGSWRAEDGWVCNLCHRLNRSCVWRQDNKKVRTSYFCQWGKISCTVDRPTRRRNLPRR